MSKILEIKNLKKIYHDLKSEILETVAVIKQNPNGEITEIETVIINIGVKRRCTSSKTNITPESASSDIYCIECILFLSNEPKSRG